MKKSLATELRSLISTVKNLDYESKELQNSISAVTNAFDEKVADAGGTKHLEKVRHSVRDIKEQLRQASLQEAMLYSTLFGYRRQQSGHHFLYDAIEEGPDRAGGEDAEFTEADLINDMPVVKSEPKKTHVEPLDPQLNPYTNPNLDADLSSTIKRGNRKTINAQEFQLKEAKEPGVKSDSETTHDRTCSGPTGSGGSSTRRLPTRPT